MLKVLICAGDRVCSVLHEQIGVDQLGVGHAELLLLVWGQYRGMSKEVETGSL